MAHSQEIAEAGDVRSFDSVNDAAAALEDLLTEELEGDDEDEDSEPETEADEVEDEGDELDDEQEDEPETPAIAPPVSLTAEEKAEFAQLPIEAQQLLTKVETRRNLDVQQATTKAAEAQREAQAAAANAQMEAQRSYAERYNKLVSAYAPQMPDPNLAYTDPQTYIAHKAQYDAEFAQHSQLMQQIDAMQAQAVQHEQAKIRQWEAEQFGELMKDSAFADTATRATFLEEFFSFGAELGIPREGLEQASASEIQAIRKARRDHEDAEQWRAAQGKRMQRVRDAKSIKPNTSQPVGAGKVRQRNETLQRVRQSGDVNDAAAAILALG